ncbi:MAG: ATP-binding protein [Acidobacteriota bacterium]|nr:ATP-binding protein [Acidobacteriota bacterium]
MTFRTRLFLSSLAAAGATLVVATVLVSWSIRESVSERIERSLIAEARLTAELLARQRPSTRLELDAEADDLGRLGSARITFIAPDGTVVGDSEVAADALVSVQNHGDRPEVRAALTDGLGVATRYSSTIDTDMLYVAVPIPGPPLPDLRVVRLALPLTEVQEQLAVVRRAAVAGLLAGLAVALVLTWITSTLLARRMRAIAAAARRYTSGDLTRPARDSGLDEIGTVARVLDETVQEVGRRAEELASSRARMEAILGGMIEGVLVVNEQGRLQLMNTAARRMLRLAANPGDQHYLEIVRHPDIAAQIGAALAGNATEGRELTLPQQPGAIFMSRSAPVTAGTTRGAVLVLHDISDLRRADQVRRDFVANVSHELRTPLTAVRGYVEALLDGIQDPEQSRRFLETVARHTFRMERLVRDLLRLARLDAGQESRERVPCSVNALFDGVTTDLAEAATLRRISITSDVASEAATVTGDPAKLHDALRNLLENAINYSPDGGTVLLASRRDDTRIVITVSDKGPGIPEADLGRVFERFYRVDKARTRDGKDPGGTGLGLAIVKHLIELHGGKASAANRPQGGAIFTIDLPV